MKQMSVAVVLLLSMLLLTIGDASEVRSYHEKSSGENLQNYKDYRWFMNQLPTVLYNLCALYYVSPDCLDEMFGEEFDMTSLIEGICPMF